MRVFLFTFVPLVAAFAVHWIWWRVALPSRQLRVLLLVFLGGFATAAVVCWTWPSLLLITPNEAAWWWSFVYFTIFYWAAAFCYVITYSAMEGDSPTLALVLELRKARDEGWSKERLENFFAERPFLRARLSKLASEGMLVESNGIYSLARGSSPAFDLILWWRRRVLGFTEWGG